MRRGPLFLFGFLGILMLSLAPVMGTVPEAKPVLHEVTPYGYTWSLLLFALPLAAIAAFSPSRQDRIHSRRAMWTTICIFAPIGFLLDIFLGLLFFEFPNTGATLGWYLPGYDWQSGGWVRGIPAEEFAFYGFGVAFVITFYIWLNENFLSLYSRSSGSGSAESHISWAALGIGAALIVVAVMIRHFGPAAGQPGFPGWAVFLILVGFLPAGLFFNTVCDRVNWQAFAFTTVTTMFISLIWEVTLALPYQWWGFRDEQMLGIYIDGWTRIPIEEPILWVLVSFTTIISYEAVKMALERRSAVPSGSALLSIDGIRE